MKRNGVFGPYQNVPPDKLKTSLARGRPAHFRYVPKIYHGCVSRRLIERLRNGNGDVFRYDIPDVYFQVAATVVGAKGITSRHPATIWGGSAASTGGGQFGNTSGKLDTSADTAFGRFVQEAGSDPTATVPFNPCFASTDYYSYASLLVAAQAYGLQTPVDHDAWAARVVRQLSLNPSHWKIAQQATAMSPLDERIISALGNLGRTPKAEAAPTSVVKQRSSRKLSRCNLETQIDGADTVCTATQILETSFGSRHRDFPAVPGWQVVQLLRWTQLLAASRGIITA